MPLPATGLDPAAADRSEAATVIRYARAQLGKPYALGGAGPNTWDCSGLTMQAYAQVGIRLPHHAALQMTIGTPVRNRADLQPGDLLFPSTLGVLIGDHVQLYEGNDTLIEAPTYGIPVREVPLSHWYGQSMNITARRLIGTVPTSDAPTAATAANPLTSSTNLLANAGVLTGDFLNPLFWQRVGKFALGFGMVALAVIVLFFKSDLGKSITSKAKDTAKAGAEAAAVAA